MRAEAPKTLVEDSRFTFKTTFSDVAALLRPRGTFTSPENILPLVRSAKDRMSSSDCLDEVYAHFEALDFRRVLLWKREHGFADLLNLSEAVFVDWESGHRSSAVPFGHREAASFRIFADLVDWICESPEGQFEWDARGHRHAGFEVGWRLVTTPKMAGAKVADTVKEDIWFCLKEGFEKKLVPTPGEGREKAAGFGPTWSMEVFMEALAREAKSCVRISDTTGAAEGCLAAVVPLVPHMRTKDLEKLKDILSFSDGRVISYWSRKACKDISKAMDLVAVLPETRPEVSALALALSRLLI